MSASKSFAVAASLALVALALTSGLASAQGGAPNPSGGTSAEPTVFDSGVFAMPAPGSDYASIGSSLRGWFLNLRISRQTAFARVSRFQGRTQTATVPKRLTER